MSRTRKFGGFSLVEMMLLLIVVSLMIASGVSVISKKHVKVPRVAMHGAYMCYYNKQGKLHEEKYVGIGTAKKIWDENVDVCRFIPPDRASYFYIQAVGGGGAGGSSGYDPEANRKTITSAVEVISPFGITTDLLKLKGITEGELSSYGGTLHAYARGDGTFGDAGNGGDLYYIKKETGNCFAYRKWSSESSSPKTKQCKPHNYKTLYSGRYKENYTYTYNESISGPSRTCETYASKSDWYREAYWNMENFTCNGDYYTDTTETICSGGTYENSCDYEASLSGAWCSSTGSVSYCKWTDYWDSSTWSWVKVCTGGTYENPCVAGYVTLANGTQKWAGCNSGSTSYCRTAKQTTREYEWGTCGSCSWRTRTSGSCEFEYNKPVFADCQKVNNTIGVFTEDTFSASGAHDVKPKLYVKETDGQLTYGSGASHDRTCSGSKCDTDVRELKVNEKDTYTVCNYGNSTAYGRNSGITGSCFEGKDCDGFTCNASDITRAFGDGVLVMGTASTSISRAEDKKADKELYKGLYTTVNGKQHEGIYYARSEDLGMDAAFGTVCKNDYANGKICDGTSKTYSTDYTNPLNGKNPATETLQTDCNITEFKYTKVNNNSCYNKWLSGDCSGNRSKQDYDIESYDCDDSYWSYSGYESYTCDDKVYTGERCMYSTADLANKGSTYAGNVYGYIIDVVEGEEGGKGQKCAVKSGAGVDVTYEAWSSIVPGVSGSDKTTSTVNEYKALWCESCAGNWATWLNQQPVYADSGTDSVGSAYVNLNGALCDVHINQQPEGGYGACLLQSENTYTLPNESGGSVSAKIPEAYAGVEHEACKYEAKGSCTHDDGIPSWCKPGDSRYPNCKNMNKDGSCNASGCGKSAPNNCENGSFVGYCLDSKQGGIRQFGKYTYQYTWSENNLAYGDPGKPGEYKSMIIRSFKDRDLIVIPGKGGTVAACNGNKGEDTLIYSVPRDAEVEDSQFVTDVDGVELMLEVSGGRGGNGCITTEPEQLPYHFTRPFPSRSVKGDLGKAPTFNNRSNVMGMVLPLDDSVLGKWLQYSGAAGDGGGSVNNFWASSWERKFEGQRVKGTVALSALGVEYWSENELRAAGLTRDWDDIPATPGIAGAVLIKW